MTAPKKRNFSQWAAEVRKCLKIKVFLVDLTSERFMDVVAAYRSGLQPATVARRRG